MVLAGFIAHSDKWAEFSRDWGAALGAAPPIEYFKMNEAAACQGQFYAWSRERRDQRVAQFYRIIENYAEAALWTCVSRDSYAHYFRLLGVRHKQYKNPYYMLLFSLIGSFGRHKQLLGIDEAVELIIDEQMHAKDQVMEAWSFFKSDEKTASFLKQTLQGDPIYRDDKNTLPLQAADIHAWWVRRRFEAKMSGKEPKVFPFKNEKSFRSLGFDWTEQALIAASASMTEADIKLSHGNVPLEVLIKLGLWP